MSSVVIKGNTSGQVTLDAPAVAGTTVLTLPTTTGTVATTADITSGFTGSNQSLGSNGYQKLPGGLIIQWGNTGSLGSNATGTVTFPVAFPTACQSVTTTATAAAGSIATLNVTAKSTTTFTYGAYGTSSYYWIAIGY